MKKPKKPDALDKMILHYQTRNPFRGSFNGHMLRLLRAAKRDKARLDFLCSEDCGVEKTFDGQWAVLNDPVDAKFYGKNPRAAIDAAMKRGGKP